MGVNLQVNGKPAQANAVTLVTVVETWGSAPRSPGALLAVRDDGGVSGPVSGACVEDDLIARIRAGEYADLKHPSMGAYGVTKEEATRFGLPCGGTLRLVQERVLDTGWIAQVLQRTSAHRQCSQRDKATKHFLGQKNPQGASAAGFGRQVTVDVTRLWVHQPW